MAEISGNGHGDARDGAVIVNLKEEDELQQQNDAIHNPKPLKKHDSLLSFSVPFLQKVFTSVTLNLQNPFIPDKNKNKKSLTDL